MCPCGFFNHWLSTNRINITLYKLWSLETLLTYTPLRCKSLTFKIHDMKSAKFFIIEPVARRARYNPEVLTLAHCHIKKYKRKASKSTPLSIHHISLSTPSPSYITKTTPYLFPIPQENKDSFLHTSFSESRALLPSTRTCRETAYSPSGTTGFTASHPTTRIYLSKAISTPEPVLGRIGSLHAGKPCSGETLSALGRISIGKEGCLRLATNARGLWARGSELTSVYFTVDPSSAQSLLIWTRVFLD